MSSWEARSLEETLKLIMRLVQHKLAQITRVVVKRKDGKKIRKYKSDVGHDPTVRLSVATEGFGLLGERDPVILNNVRALNKLYTLYELWVWELMEAGYSREEAERALKPVLLIIKRVESELYARSYTGQSVVAPLSYVLGRMAVKLRREAVLEAEAVGAGAVSPEAEKSKAEE